MVRHVQADVGCFGPDEVWDFRAPYAPWMRSSCRKTRCCVQRRAITCWPVTVDSRVLCPYLSHAVRPSGSLDGEGRPPVRCRLEGWSFQQVGCYRPIESDKLRWSSADAPHAWQINLRRPIPSGGAGVVAVFLHQRLRPIHRHSIPQPDDQGIAAGRWEAPRQISHRRSQLKSMLSLASCVPRELS